MSPSRFHEVFRRSTGETVKQYTLRLRLERAAFRLLTERTSVAAIAFDLGFGSHEAFTRAFRGVHHRSPSDFRRQVRPPSLTRDAAATVLTPDFTSVSTTSAVLLQPAHVAFVRRIGPYELVDPGEYATLLDWVGRRGLDAIGLVGIAHDAPGITPEARLRFDVGVQVTRPFRSGHEVGYQLLPERWCAATSYVGPFSGLAAAYEKAFRAASELRGFDVLGLPVEERYLTTALLTRRTMQTTQILIPLRRTLP
jgi:AraC family transcriptional regulator